MQNPAGRSPIEKAPAPQAEELVDLEQMVAVAEQEMENQFVYYYIQKWGMELIL